MPTKDLIEVHIDLKVGIKADPKDLRAISDSILGAALGPLLEKVIVLKGKKDEKLKSWEPGDDTPPKD